ncbi:MAG: C25 family cysteine peptidase, partial [Chloroflexota bacterium]
VAVATTDDIYNEFGFGAESPTAIRDFLAYAFRNWPKPAPRFVLLVGKASYDTRDMLHAPNKNLLPTFLRSTLNLGETGDDNAFVVFDEASPAPQMAIGRLPVKTDAQLATVIEKIIAYESAGAADWRGRALFIADDKDSDFETMSEDFIGRLPQGVTVTRAYLRANPVVSGTNGGGAASGGLVPTKQAIVTNWNQGAALVSYVGHGSITLWAAGPLFAASDANALRNAERLPFLLTPTCLDGYFLDAQQDSLAEQLLFKPDGGIIGGFVPTGLSFSASQRKLATGFLDALFQSPPPTVGEAIMRAKQAMPSPDRADAEVIETFTLLGDPALTLVIGR